MSDIVWAIDPKHDRLFDLAARMRRFAADMLVTRQIAFQSRPSTSCMTLRRDTDQRRQIFLVFKEAVHNAVRHSGCTEIRVVFWTGRTYFVVLHVSDNGKGFDADAAADGHGLSSMRARTRAIGGRLKVTSEPAHGTTICSRCHSFNTRPLTEQPADPVSVDGVCYAES